MQFRLIAGLLSLALTSLVTPTAHSQEAPRPVAPPNPQRDAASAAINAAVQQHDYRRAIAVENSWVAQHPTDFDFRHMEPLFYRLAGDEAGWEHARSDLLQRWAASGDTLATPASPSFTVDLFKVGQDMIIADQCYERAGRFGVIYRFSVVGPDRQVNSFFTVESPEADNQSARERGQPSPVFTLDHFRPGIHETVAMLPGLPAYADLRQRVLAYMADPRPISSSSNGGNKLANEGCGTNRPAPTQLPG